MFKGAGVLALYLVMIAFLSVSGMLNTSSLISSTYSTKKEHNVINLTTSMVKKLLVWRLKQTDYGTNDHLTLSITLTVVSFFLKSG